MIKRLLPKVFMAVCIIVLGLLWLISGVSGAFMFSFRSFWSALLMAIGITFLMGVFCYNSKGYLYFFVVFAGVGAIFFTAHNMDGGFENLKTLWPLFIGVFGVASLVMFFARNFAAAHIKFALLFIGLSVAFYLANSKVVGWQIMIPIMVVLFGLILLANMVFRQGKSWDMAENEDVKEDTDFEEKFR